MHITRVLTKFGATFRGYLTQFKPDKNFFLLSVAGEEKKFSFDNVLAVVTEGERLPGGKIGDLDELDRARNYLIEGRAKDWFTPAPPRMDWETPTSSPVTRHLVWIEPPWRRPQTAEEGSWPYVGDLFLAAIPVEDSRLSKRRYWEYHVLSWSESGLEQDGEAFSAFDSDDIEWIARIEAPQPIEEVKFAGDERSGNDE